MLALGFHWALTLSTRLGVARVTKLYEDDAELYDIA
jgi:hypothetical protein